MVNAFGLMGSDALRGRFDGLCSRGEGVHAVNTQLTPSVATCSRKNVD